LSRAFRTGKDTTSPNITRFIDSSLGSEIAAG
jgi:hypothetical protein